jgi:broad specificity phosphatase PhoE
VIHLVRHGETSYNRDGLGLGRADVPLTEHGIEQANALALRFGSARIDRVLSSPLARAHSVATRIAAGHGLTAEPLEALTELDVGDTEGLGFAEMRRRFPEFLAEWGSDRGWLAQMPGGESIQDLSGRLDSIASEMLSGTGDEEVVVVSHNFTLRVLVCRILGLEASKFRAFEHGLAAVTTLSVRNGRVAVHSMNDRCHLANLSLA